MRAPSEASPRQRAAIRRPLHIALLSIALAAVSASASAVCPEKPPLQNFTGGGSTICPCFVPGEEAGSVFNAPAGDYPIEILRVGIGWGSQLGGAPQSLEAAIHVYGTGLPNPGTPIFSLPGPQLNDGFLNEFDLEPISGEILVNSGPFTVTLEFLNQNSNDEFAPSVVHDGNGCQAGKNVVFAIPGGWFSACALGVSGDWLFYVVYRRTDCLTSVGEEVVVSSLGSALLSAQPNPFDRATQIRFVIADGSRADLTVYDATGRVVTNLVSGAVGSGLQTTSWDGTDGSGRSVAAGTYFLRLNSGIRSETRRVTVVR